MKTVAPTQPESSLDDCAQAIEQCRAVAHMARELANVHEARALILQRMDDPPVEIIGQSSAEFMEWLGDTLSNMDAVEAEDSWLDPVFERAHARWPLQSQGREVPTGQNGWQPIETAPRDDRVLLFVPAFGAWIASWWPGSWSYAREQWAIHSPFARGDKAIFGVDAPQPTHWMPLPAPPTSGASSPMDAAPATGHSLNSEARPEGALASSGPDEPTPDSAEDVSVELRQRMGRE